MPTSSEYDKIDAGQDHTEGETQVGWTVAACIAVVAVARPLVQTLSHSIVGLPASNLPRSEPLLLLALLGIPGPLLGDTFMAQAVANTISWLMRASVIQWMYCRLAEDFAAARDHSATPAKEWCMRWLVRLLAFGCAVWLFFSAALYWTEVQNPLLQIHGQCSSFLRVAVVTILAVQATRIYTARSG